jgi:hypothetical protein
MSYRLGGGNPCARPNDMISFVSLGDQRVQTSHGPWVREPMRRQPVIAGGIFVRISRKRASPRQLHVDALAPDRSDQHDPDRGSGSAGLGRGSVSLHRQCGKRATRCEKISADATEATVAAELGERLGRWRANVRGALSGRFMDRMGDERGPLQRRHSGKGRAVPELSPFDPDLHFASRGPCFGGTPDSKRAARGSDI